MISAFDDEVEQVDQEDTEDQGEEVAAGDDQQADHAGEGADEESKDDVADGAEDGAEGEGEDGEENGEVSGTAVTGAVLRQVDDGVPGADVEVTMADSADAAYPTSVNDGRTIWTWMMGDCCAIATYNPENGERTLVHLKGGQAGKSYYEKLVSMISDDTDVIMASGTNYASEEGFRGTACSMIQEQLNAAFANEGRAFDQSKYQVFWTAEADDKARGMKMGSFGINANAEYGRVLA